MKRSTVNILASYIDALHPIIYINHFDFKVIDDAILTSVVVVVFLIHDNTKMVEFMENGEYTKKKKGSE